MPNGVQVPAPVAAPTYYAPPRRRMTSTQAFAAAALVAGGGWLAYKYWYLPAQARKAINDLYRRNLAQGMSPADAKRAAFAGVCGAGASAVGAAYGLPLDPRLMQDVCTGLPEFTEVAVDIGKTAVGGAVSILEIPVKAGASVVRDVYKGSKDFVSDAYGAGKDVVGDILNTTKDILAFWKW